MKRTRLLYLSPLGTINLSDYEQISQMTALSCVTELARQILQRCFTKSILYETNNILLIL